MASDLTTPFDLADEKRIRMAPGPGIEEPVEAEPSPYSDEELLELWEEIRKETIDGGHKAFSIQWRRNIYYLLYRQWIEYIAGRGWRDKRMASWIPRPVTNKCKDVLQAIRAVFTGIKLGVNVRPAGADPKNVSAAATAGELAPVLHEAHNMNEVLSEFDFWLIATGNAFLHTFVDYDIKNGRISVPIEQCQACGAEYTTPEIDEAGGTCPDCQSPDLAPAAKLDGTPKVKYQAKGKPTTLVLSPLELAFPNSYPRFSELPYVVRLRWRTKRYFESNAALKPLIEKISWQKAPSDENLGLFHSLSTHNDLGMAGSTGYAIDRGGVQNEEGITEYEVWMKPTEAYPDGLVFRIYGERNPIVAHLEATEALPGPLPYKDAEGNPLFTFTHGGYEPVGGRILASGPIDAIIQKQDLLNQLDSMVLMIIQRMANPVWMIPKGSEISKFSGMPGLVMRWSAHAAGGAKPERIPGEGPHPTIAQLREQYIKDMEESAGTFEIIKGAKPTGVEAFTALQLLVEQAQSRFALVFQARGDAYKDWFSFAIELEREFGPDERTKAVLSPARTWTFETFKKAQLQGSFSIVLENGSTAPKTNLGLRAAVQQAQQLGLLTLQDPDEKYEGLKLFGLTSMAPTLDIHVQAALQKQEAFEEWVINPQNVLMFGQMAQQKLGMYQQQLQGATDPNQPMPAPPKLLEGIPLEWHGWYEPIIHRQELMKWANSDRMREIFKAQPAAQQIVEMHLQEIEQQLAMRMAAQSPQAPPAQGAGMAMENSNRESGKSQEPKGTGEGAQTAGPR